MPCFVRTYSLPGLWIDRSPNSFGWWWRRCAAGRQTTVMSSSRLGWKDMMSNYIMYFVHLHVSYSKFRSDIHSKKYVWKNLKMHICNTYNFHQLIRSSNCMSIIPFIDHSENCSKFNPLLLFIASASHQSFFFVLLKLAYVFSGVVCDNNPFCSAVRIR